jgi:LacI family transcriptional regulator
VIGHTTGVWLPQCWQIKAGKEQRILVNKKRRATIVDVAKAANVSNMSVSRVINNQPGVSAEVRQLIRAKMDELGYSSSPIARSIRGNSHMIGLVVPNLTSGYVGSVLSGVADAANRLGYGLMLYVQGGEEGGDTTSLSEAYASQLANGFVQGVLLVSPRHYDVFVNEWDGIGLKYVVIDHYSETRNEPAVITAGREGARSATRHLLALGHTRIGFISGPLSMQIAVDRVQGYKDVLNESRIEYDEALIVEGTWYHASGYDCATQLLALPNPPTAIIASSDNMAFGVMDAVRERGLKLPADISVIGFGDIPNAMQYRPALTTVRQHMHYMGSIALEHLVDLMEGRIPSSRRIEVPTELVIRDTTAPKKSGS